MPGSTGRRLPASRCDSGRSGTAAVALLVGEGLTRKQAGVRLFLAVRTADSHVHAILTELGATSRAADRRLAGGQVALTSRTGTWQVRATASATCPSLG